MKKILIILILFSGIQVKAQINDFAKNVDSFLFNTASNLGWVKFNDNINIHPEKIFDLHPDAFGLTSGFSMRKKRLNIGTNGYNHYKFEQFYNNIKVEFGEYIIHSKDGKLISGNGKIYTPKYKSTTIIVPEQIALLTAINNINAKEYYWQNEIMEARLKQKTKNPLASYYPNAKKIYFFNEQTKSLNLAYKFFIKTIDVGKSCIVYLDATSGIVLQKIPTEYLCDFTTFNSNFYGIQNLYTNDVAVFGNSYDLEDDCTSSVYGVYDATNNNNIFNTGNNQWVSDWQRSAATSLWGIKASWFHFNSFFGRNGHDNNNGDLDIYQGVNFGTAASPNFNNASYSYDEFGDDEIKFGTGNSPSVLDDWNPLDIAAHEFTHGVTRYEANLVYSREQGALNESFSDIFGEFVESRVFGNANWIVGWERRNPSNNTPTPLRYMANPAATNINLGGFTLTFTDPNTYQGSNWFPAAGVSVNNCTPTFPPGPNNDACGVHTNSGVQNHMAYLLASGGNGWNNGLNSYSPPNNGYQWSVAAIGIDKMARIAYKALVDYLGTNSNYFDARNAWVHAAIELYGECSFEAIQTGKAWYAVGIGPPPAPGNLICGNYGAANYYLNKPGQINIASTCNVDIAATGNTVQFASGNRVTIGAGFKALNGSRFIANIFDDCKFATY
jgi:bacillolysin